MKAVILAGGLGTRLHPLTIDLPKPMVPMANRPLMDYLVKLLAGQGFDDISILLYHQPEIIKDYFGGGERHNVKITYHEAPADYGTAGAVKFACQGVREPFLVISADLLTDMDLAGAVNFHRQKKALATLVLVREENPLPYGIVITDKEGRINRFLEKPSWSEVFSDTINAGIYVVDPAALDYVPFEKPFDFSLDLFPLLLKEKKTLMGYTASGYWKDIGKIDDYGRVHYDLVSGAVKIVRSKDGKAVIAKSAALEGHCLVGEDSIIADEAVLINSILGRECRVGRGAFLKDCILWDGVEVGPEAKLDRVIACRKVKIGANTNIGEGVVVGDETEIGRDVEIKPFIKIWPRKFIEEGSTVCSSIVWRERWNKSIFGQYGVTGLFDLEITPQFAASLGAAYGSVLRKGARITCSHDSHKASQMVFRGLIAGVLSTGVNISNLQMVPIPVNRYEIRSLKSQGGFHVRKSPFDPEMMDIKFFDGDGMDLSSALEKRIERKFFSEDFARTSIEETGELAYPYHQVAEEYKTGMLGMLDQKTICASNLKLVIDYSFGPASQIFPSILGELGMEVVALDAYIDETKITKDRAAFERGLTQMTKIVKSINADTGIMLDTGAEKIFFSDERGNVIDGNRALGIMALVALKSRPHAVIAVPVKETRMVEELAARFKGKVLRTKNSFRGMMEVAEAGGVAFLGESQGGYIYPEFIPSFDGMLSAAKLAEFLAREKVSVSELAAEIPAANIQSLEIACSSEQKGLVMRSAIDQARGVDRFETLDGIKFWQDGDWALILPDAMRPVVHLYAEAKNENETRRLLDKYVKMIEKIKEG